MLLGIDIGTTTICGVAVLPAGERVATVQRANDSAVGGLPAGRAEQSPARIRERVFEVLRELASAVRARGASAQSIAGIGLTGQMHGTVCVNRSGEACSNLITWQDARCNEEVSPGKTLIAEMLERAPAPMWNDCGCLPASGFLGSTLYWMQRTGQVPEQTARVAFIHDWIVGQLGGQLPVTDPGDAGSAGCFDLSRLEWHAGIVRALGLPRDLLPPVRESGEVLGRLSASAAAASGLPEGVPVCNAIGDNQASVLGSVADLDRSILLNLGTGGQISWVVPSFRRAAGMETRYLPRKRFMLVGASLCGGRAYAWLNDTVRAWLSDFGVTLDRTAAYEKLNVLAAAAPTDASGLRAVTTFAGTRSDPSIRGSFNGIDLANFTLGNVARAVLGGIIDELASLYPQEIASPHTSVVVSGNAVRANPVLPKLIAERMGRPIRIPMHQEEAAFGAALMAGVGVGVWPDLAAAGRCVAYVN